MRLKRRKKDTSLISKKIIGFYGEKIILLRRTSNQLNLPIKQFDIIEIDGVEYMSSFIAAQQFSNMDYSQYHNK